MPIANIQDRKSIEEVYPPAAFASDAAYNGQVTHEVILGVRILSAPDAKGDFDLERSRQHIGEAATPTFLAPHRREKMLTNKEEDTPAAGVELPHLPAGYMEFVDDVAAAARQFGFEPEKSPGRNEPRLQGLRQ
jgi:hypothetical protein